MREKVTITDIAQESGVSPATVSLVLRNRPGVSEETRARVIEVAETLGYQIRPAIPTTRNGRLQTVGMIVKTEPNIPARANPFYSHVIIGVEDACRRHGIDLLLSTMPVDEHNRPLGVPQMLARGAADALLMVGTFVDETILSISSRKTPPIVLVDAYSKTESYDAVVSDNFQASWQAVEYLIRRGHRHIGLVGSEPDAYPSIRQRRGGYLRALRENGIAESYIADFNIIQDSGYEPTRDLLRKYPHITALFGVNDQVAVAAMSAAQDMGRRVPDDLSVIGYDDVDLAENAKPPLTTMHVDTVAMGRAAVQLLLDRIDNSDSARMTLTIHPAMVERESVAKARQVRLPRSLGSFAK
ncbi:MAG: LacI family transcriptional regulator [Chloroflexi bacterium]|nr:LacI family transcriptional regulator [Chloroflexota bacterium]